MFETGEWLNQRYGQFLGQLYQPDVWLTFYTFSLEDFTFFFSFCVGRVGSDYRRCTNKNDNGNGFSRSLSSERYSYGMEYTSKLAADTYIFWTSWRRYCKQKRNERSHFSIRVNLLLWLQLLLVRTPCPRYYEALQEVFASPELQRVSRDNEQMYRELTQLTGMDVKTPDDVQSLYSTLRAETEYGLELPDWTRDYYPDKLLNLTRLSVIYNVYTDEMKKLKAGPFLQKMIKEWNQKRDGVIEPKDRKIYLYTGHDSTVVNILHALGVWKLQLPLYGIMTIFELLEDTTTGEYGISVYLRNTSKSGAIRLTIPGCSRFCPLDRFIELTRKFIIMDKERECAARDINFIAPAPSGP